MKLFGIEITRAAKPQIKYSRNYASAKSDRLTADWVLNEVYGTAVFGRLDDTRSSISGNLAAPLSLDTSPSSCSTVNVTYRADRVP